MNAGTVREKRERMGGHFDCPPIPPFRLYVVTLIEHFPMCRCKMRAHYARKAHRAIGKCKDVTKAILTLAIIPQGCVRSTLFDVRHLEKPQKRKSRKRAASHSPLRAPPARTTFGQPSGAKDVRTAWRFVSQTATKNARRFIPACRRNCRKLRGKTTRRCCPHKKRAEGRTQTKGTGETPHRRDLLRARFPS